MTIGYPFNFQGLFFSMAIHLDTLKKAHVVKAVISEKLDALQSTAFAPQLNRNYDAIKESAEYNYMDITYFKLTTYNLPPYWTRCFDYGGLLQLLYHYASGHGSAG